LEQVQASEALRHKPTQALTQLAQQCPAVISAQDK
jgi:hypothetical protein